MSRLQLKHVTIVGVGLLGGSLGLAVKKRFGALVAGVGRRQSSLDEALACRAIDTAHLDAAEIVGRSDLVILATPVGAFESYLKAVAPRLKKGAIVTDVGSTKQQVVRWAKNILGPAGPFVGSHPMAGSETKGPNHAREDLFRAATCVITPDARTPRRAVTYVEQFWRELGMNVVQMSAAEHDKAAATISHLPHALSSLLMLLPQKKHVALAATGFRDMTRLAGGDAEMWRDIFLTNRQAVLGAIDDFDELLMRLRDLVDTADGEAMLSLLAAAKAKRDNFLSRR